VRVRGRPKVDDPNERVIHARIPASLEAEIKRIAEKLRIPVSNLVRNMLADAVAVVDGVQENVDHAMAGLRSSLGRLAASERPKSAKPLARVVAWQEVVLAQDARCAGCGASLPQSARAYLGLTARAEDRVFSCTKCAPTFEAMEP
jgi:hypothetical protein